MVDVHSLWEVLEFPPCPRHLAGSLESMGEYNKPGPDLLELFELAMEVKLNGCGGSGK